jgi:mercuric ion binding protein
MTLNKLRTGIALVLGVVASSTALAAERTITLTVQNMYCAVCPYTVKASLEAVRGVKSVVVSYKAQTAVVTYDDAATEVKTLIAATTNAGYPSGAQ